MFSNYIVHQRKLFYSKLKNRLLEKEAKKLDEKMLLDEMTLTDYEWLAGFNAQALEEFLRDNDEDTIAAGRLVEETSLEKAEKARELESLQVQVNDLKEEVRSTSEAIRECKQYMGFLSEVAREILRRDEEISFREQMREKQEQDEVNALVATGMTPEDALNQIRDIYNKAKDDMDQSLEIEQRGVLRDLEMEEALDNIRKDFQTMNMVGISPSCMEILNERNDGFDQKGLFNDLDLVPGDEKSDKEELNGLVFSEPHQLLNIFKEMEEQNASLLKHSQATDEYTRGFEEQIAETYGKIARRTKELREDINKREGAINRLMDRIHSVSLIIEMFDGENISVKRQEKLLSLFSKHLKRVFEVATGTTVYMNPILMLTTIEKAFEDLVKEISTMPDDVVATISREMDKEHREAEREEKSAAKRRGQLLRLKKSAERALMPVAYKGGRKVMARSKPKREELKLSQKGIDEKAEEEEYNYYFGED